MQITKISKLTKIAHTLEIPITESEWSAYQMFKDKLQIQDVFPRLTADEREFLLTGITKDEWETVFGGCDE